MESDEEDEDGDDEEEVEKGGGTECDEGTGGEEDQMVLEVESGPAAAKEGGFVPSEKEQDSVEWGGEMRQAAKDELIFCETGKTENDDQTQFDKGKTDKAVTDLPEQAEEDNKELTVAGNEISETTSMNTNQDRHTETEGDTQGQSNAEEKLTDETKSHKLPENETEGCKTVIDVDDCNNKVSTVEKAEQNCPTEAMEVEATETSPTDTSEAVRGEQDNGTGLILTLSHTLAQLFYLESS